MFLKYDVVIIGGGPGGYVCAIRCAQYGLKTAVIEKDLMGGTCLNRGCIPTKTLLFAADLLSNMKKGKSFGVDVQSISTDYPALKSRCSDVVGQLRDGVLRLLKKHKVDIYDGIGTVVDQGQVSVKGKDGETILETENIVLATGTVPAVPPITGADLPGVYTSDSLLSTLPALKELVIVGGGVIGVEFAEAYHAFGAKVTILEMLPRLLPPFDTDLARHLAASFKKKGIAVVTGAGVTSIEKGETGLTIRYKLGEEEKSAGADGVLIAVGRRAQLDGLLPFALKKERNLIVVDQSCRTSEPGIYAIGDITYGYPQLAHSAEAQGKAAAAAMAGKECDIDFALIPQCVYTKPEIASIGMSEDEAKKSGGNLKISRVMMGTNAKSLIADEAGFIKMVIDEEDRILGASLLCRDADNLIGEVGLAVSQKMKISDFVKIIRPHPSLEEALGETAEAAHGIAIHTMPR